MKVIPTPIEGVLLVQPRVFRDPRGLFLESYTRKKYQDAGIGMEFVQDNHSVSEKNVVRGLHYQVRNAQDKLVRATRGEIFDVAVDIRPGSPTFGQWTGHRLSADNMHQLFIPAGLAHGFAVLTDVAELQYKCSNYYFPDDERGIIWNDPDLAIDWPVADPILSEKDSGYPRLRDLFDLQQLKT